MLIIDVRRAIQIDAAIAISMPYADYAPCHAGPRDMLYAAAMIRHDAIRHCRHATYFAFQLQY